jgi:glycerol-3-phosphate dehydrogenase (NAD(P)+)
MAESLQSFGVIGAGAWGTALAQVLARGGRDVRLWAHHAETARTINETRENPDYLPGAEMEAAIVATADLAALADCDAILSVTPAQHTRRVLAQFAPHARAGLPVVLCSKGIEQETLKPMTDVLAETVPHARAAILSGPSFASDVSAGRPAAVTLACADDALGAALGRAIAIPTFRLYATRDLVGAEIGGAVKNVLAIAAGITEGRGLGRSAHAALVTRGFAEMARLGAAMDASMETLSGLAGLGDLMLTCSSPQSRNMSLGLALGRGEALAAVLGARKAVTEGVATASAVSALADRHEVEMPICAAVCAVLDGRLTVAGAIDALLARPLKNEGV